MTACSHSHSFDLQPFFYTGIKKSSRQNILSEMAFFAYFYNTGLKWILFLNYILKILFNVLHIFSIIFAVDNNKFCMNILHSFLSLMKCLCATAYPTTNGSNNVLLYFLSQLK